MPYAPADTSFFSKRGLILVGILALHAVFFWALNASMSQGLIQKILGPIETRIIESAPEEEEAPPPPPPKIETPPPFVPPPDISIDIPAEAPPATAITQTTTQRPVAQPPPAPPAAKKPGTQPKSDPRRPLTQPEYPPSSRRAGEAGTVILEVYVLENGRVGDARVKQSSGFPRLDEAAVREVKRSWRLIPGTEDGKPVAMWGQFAVTFKLTD
jgi:protein TonB